MILSCVIEGNPTKCIKWITVTNSFESLFTELNLRNVNWLLGCSYNSHKDKTISHLNTIDNVLDKVCTDAENFILLGDFNVAT